MSREEKERKKSIERGVDLGVDTALEALGPVTLGASSLVKWIRQAHKDRREKRVEDFFRQLLMGDSPMTEEQCKEAVEKEPLCSEIPLRLLEDDEDDKVWVYAGQFRAFAHDLVPKKQRVRFLRCTRDLTNADLLGMRTWHKSAVPLVTGPYVTFRISFEKQYREWFIQPEIMQEQNPHVIEVLCRWGFISRVHERAKQAKLDDGRPPLPMSDTQHPMPGRTRLQVEPAMALFSFVVSCITQGNGLELGRGKEVSTVEEGRVDAIDFHCERKAAIGALDFDGTSSTMRQKHPGPTVDAFKYETEAQLRILSARLESLPTDPQAAIRELRNIGNELNGFRRTGLTFADNEEAQRLAGPGGGTVQVRGKTINVAPPVTIRAW